MDKKTVLITEDDRFLLKLLSDAFQKDNFTIYQAMNGKEGLETALAKRPDIILLDIVMPEMDGLAMLEKLRQDDWGKNVPVIILTGFEDSDKISNAMDKRVSSYIIKENFKVEEIIQNVKELLAL